MDIYDKIDSILSEKNMSRRQLAILAGISENTISAAFRRRSKKFSTENVFKIAKALNIPWQKLVAGTEIEKIAATAMDSAMVCYSAGNRTFLNGVDVTEEYKERLGQLRSRQNAFNLPPDTVRELSEYFEMLNDEGQTEAVKRVEELTQIPKYQKRQD